MNKTKIFISIMLVFFTGIGITIGYLLTSEMYETHSGIATVIERRSASEVVVKLNEESGEKEFIVYSNIFLINDQVKIEYAKNKHKYIVSKVSQTTETDAQKKFLASRIKIDPTIIKYTNLVSLKTDNIENRTDIIAIPTKLSNQEFVLMNEQEYFRYYYDNTDIAFTLIPKNTKITLSLLNDFKIVSVENIKDEKRRSLLHNFTNKTVTFDSLGEGIYSVKLSFKNGNVINYIFV